MWIKIKDHKGLTQTNLWLEINAWFLVKNSIKKYFNKNVNFICRLKNNAVNGQRIHWVFPSEPLFYNKKNRYWNILQWIENLSLDKIESKDQIK